MVTQVIRKLASSGLPMAGLFTLLLLSLYVLGNTAENLERFGQFYVWLLVFNALGLLFISVLIGINTWNLIGQFKRRAAGSRLTVRLVIMFIVLALVPVTIVYSFSVRFLRTGIDSWYDVQVEQALEKALELSRDSVGVHMRTLLRVTENMSYRLSDVSPEVAVIILNDLRAESGASELLLLTSRNEVIAANSSEMDSVIQHRPDDSLLSQVRDNGSYVGLDPIADGGLHIRILVPVLSSLPERGEETLQVLYPVGDRINLLADVVQGEFQKYQQLSYLREPLKVSFILTLSLVLLLSVLTAVWAAFQAARRLMLPIHDLAEGTQAVADGDYSTRLATSGQDELSALARSFNDMTLKLSHARDEAKLSQLQVESQRTYLQAVLARISTGVLTLDDQQCLRTANSAAEDILDAKLYDFLGTPISQLAEQYPHLRAFIAALGPHLSSAQQEWSQEVEILCGDGRRLLVCRGAVLAETDQDAAPGVVLVFDDISALIRAQREAAWSEVARRLAHEIKNPLTPIRLSAERLRQKYLKTMPEQDAKLLDRATKTIVQQVDAMKSMVQAFSDYASAPEVHLQDIDINTLISDVADLYIDSAASLEIVLDLDAKLPLLRLEPTRMRQLLHNLIRNALEAQQEIKRPYIGLRSKLIYEGDNACMELSIVDHGPGIPQELLERVFEPYITSKVKGGGLGLAVVKKIVEEHAGVIRAENKNEAGAEMTIRIPISKPVQDNSVTVPKVSEA